MSPDVRHISVCICTYKRPDYLARLLQALASQETEDLFTYSIVVADNDGSRSAEPAISEFTAASSIPVRYCVQPLQSVPLTRNASVANATGTYIAFIDDDEFPDSRWLLTLLKALDKHGSDGVLGPVRPHFAEDTPQWVIKGKFYERPSYPTGFVIDWRKGRTGNVLMRRSALPAGEAPFRPQFQGGGADQDFFRRMIENGRIFIWCEEAVAYEVVPPIRCSRSFMLRRALLRGWAARFHPTCGARELAKSIIAVPAYTVALPFMLALGQHRFMAIMISLCDHLGKLLAVMGIRVVKQAYVTE